MLQALGWEQRAQSGLGQPFRTAPTCLAAGNKHVDKVQHSKGFQGREGRARSWDFSRRCSTMQELSCSRTEGKHKSPALTAPIPVPCQLQDKTGAWDSLLLPCPSPNANLIEVVG